jgi:hypothetical protein
MDRDFKEWFVAERARALALMLLTRRSDLVVEETKESSGLDYTVYVRDEESPGKRPFGVLMRATMSPVTREQANRQLKPTMASFQSIGPFNYPVCVLYFIVKDERGYYTWAAEPVITAEGQPRLQTHAEAHCAPLDDESLGEIVLAVREWYDAFYATITK